MPGLKCPVCNFVWRDRKQFEEMWEHKEHDNIKDCVIYLGKVNQELTECINIIEERFRHEKIMRRKILD